MPEQQAVKAGINMSWYEVNEAVDELANDTLRQGKYPDDDEWVEAIGLRIGRIKTIAAALTDTPMEGWAVRDRKSD